MLPLDADDDDAAAASGAYAGDENDADGGEAGDPMILTYAGNDLILLRHHAVTWDSIH